jgi:ketol-acid reductoisomerase
MAKATPDAVLDVMLTDIALSSILHVCSGEPANYAGIAAVSLADVVLTPGDGNGDFVIADHTSGRKLTVSQQAAVDIDVTGTATHIALAITASSTLKQVTTCTSQALVDTGTVTVPAYIISIADPT